MQDLRPIATRYAGIIPRDTIAGLERQMLDSREFPWFLNPRTTWAQADSSKFVDAWPDSSQFVHNLIIGGAWASQYARQILDILRWDVVQREANLPEKIIRMKANLILNLSGAPEHNPPHLDLGEPHTACILYINDTDGDTLFFNRTREQKPHYGDPSVKVIHRESPKAGDLIVFDGDRYHASSPPKLNGRRAVFNFTLQSAELQRSLGYDV